MDNPPVPQTPVVPKVPRRSGAGHHVAVDGTIVVPTRKQSELRKLHLENDRLELENEKLRFENQRLRTDVSRGRIDLWLRLGMAIGLFGFVCWYISAVVALAGRPTGETRLTDATLIALFGSTAVNVIGLLLTVARYLFPGAKADLQA